MSRSIWKGPFLDSGLLRKLGRPSTKRKAKINKTWSRSSTILPQFVGKTVQIHNGRKFMTLHITEDMIGHKLGEFSLTRRRPVHKVKNKK